MKHVGSGNIWNMWSWRKWIQTHFYWDRDEIRSWNWGRMQEAQSWFLFTLLIWLNNIFSFFFMYHYIPSSKDCLTKTPDSLLIIRLFYSSGMRNISRWQAKTHKMHPKKKKQVEPQHPDSAAAAPIKARLRAEEAPRVQEIRGEEWMIISPYHRDRSM